MIIRKYKGKSLESLRATVVKELGESAVIVHTEKMKKEGLAGKIGGVEYELIAAADDGAGASVNSFAGQVELGDLVKEQKRQYVHLRKNLQMLDEKVYDIDQKMEKLEEIERNMRSSQNLAYAPMGQAAGLTQTPSCLDQIHLAWRSDMERDVKNQGIEEPSGEDYFEDLKNRLPVAGGVALRKNEGEGPDVYALVGPTGVGKTTTLAKLASMAVLKEQLNVLLISIDTFRVGACAQLKEYAQLLGIELEVVFTATEMQRKLAQAQNRDLVLIDTQGRGPVDEEGIAKMKEVLSPIENLNSILVLPSNVRTADAHQIFNSFSAFDPVCQILTKADESACCDGLTALFDCSQIPCVYLSYGQRVPEDIKPASSEDLAAMIMPNVATNPFFKC